MTTTHDDGKVIPTDEALRWVEENHPEASDAEKWRLAQARTILDDPVVQEFTAGN